jgi:Tol biopolymer transport system component/DNA-binding winged helix-turn-helix (wHTH) protein
VRPDDDKLASTEVRPVPSILRFGAFEVDLAAAELRKSGIRLRLQEQPYQVLAALLEEPGNIVSREQLISRLWPDGTVVDFDRGLNAAVTRLRQVLSDSADTPRYVETVARRGYRFIAPVEAGDAAPAPAPPVASSSSRHLSVWIGGALAILVVAAAASIILLRRESPSDEPLRVLPLTTEPGFEWCPTLSPDGNQVAFQWNKPGEDSHIYVKQVGSGDPVRLTTATAAEFAPAWSRDGRYIAFLRQLDESRTAIYYVPPVGGVERPVAECPVPYMWSGFMVRRLAWLPDERGLIVSCPDVAGGNDALRLISLTGSISALTQPSGVPGFSDEEPAVSPDGRTVAFVRGPRRSQTMLYLLSLTPDLKAAGEPRPMASTVAAEAPAWTPGGEEIVYDRQSVLWRIGVAGGSPRRILELGNNLRQPTFDRRNHLAYASPVLDSNIWRQELTPEDTTARPAEPLVAFTTYEMSPDYSRDGTRIAFQSQKSGKATIWTCANDGTRCNPLTEMQSGSPRWSPNSQKIAFDSIESGNWDVLIMPATGGQAQRLTNDRADDSQPSWSHDGNFIYFSSARSGRDEIWKMPASPGARAVRITRDGGYTAFEAPGGEYLYYLKGDNDNRLWRCNLDGSDEKLILDGVSYRSFVVTADRIYYMKPETGGMRTLRVLYLRSGKQKQIAVLPNGRLGLSLSPDKRYLIYAQVDHEGSDLMLVPGFR